MMGLSKLSKANKRYKYLIKINAGLVWIKIFTIWTSSYRFKTKKFCNTCKHRDVSDFFYFVKRSLLMFNSSPSARLSHTHDKVVDTFSMFLFFRISLAAFLHIYIIYELNDVYIHYDSSCKKCTWSVSSITHIVYDGKRGENHVNNFHFELFVVFNLHIFVT